MMTTLALFGLSATFIACGDKDNDTATAESTSDALFDNTDPTEEVDPNAPVISGADAWCFVPGGSTEGEQWGFVFSYTDPQGLENLHRLQMGAIQILNGNGISTATVDPACSWDTGNCTSFPFSTQVGVGCDAATTISVKFQVTDADGNTSNSITVQGRQGEGFEG